MREEVRRLVDAVGVLNARLRELLDQDGASDESDRLALVIERVAQEFDTTVEQVKSPSREGHLVLPRHVAWWLARELLGTTTAHLSWWLRRKDHNSARLGILDTQNRMDCNARLAARVQRLKQELAGRLRRDEVPYHD